ncbi:MAG: ABC transporter permease [Rothia sp. (in: high G+C Gram-positive bacteria)]|nr:ABC transporter permease [Rothia sp. (in: high G+C Gram-positive bacteria)]
MRTRYLIQRTGQAALVLLAAFTLAFVLLTALPGDAITTRYANPELGLSEAEISEIRASYGADRPIILQYFTTLGNFLTGNFGYSVNSGTAITDLMKAALPSTLTLATLAFGAALLLAFAITYLATQPQMAWLNRAVRALPPAMSSIPSFLIGILLIQFISFQLGWVPVYGATDLQDLILPVLTLAVPISAPLAQVLIRSIDEVYTQPFITVVTARGATENWIFWRNVLRNALLPAITLAGVLFGELVGGAVVTEAVFGRAGLGNLTVQAVANRDTPVLLAIVVVAAAAYVLINLIVDLLYPLLDPRLRHKA